MTKLPVDKMIFSFTLVFMSASISYAGQIGSGGVERIVDNGRIDGDASYRIECNSGGERIVRRRNNKWTDSLGNTFSNRLWNKSLKDFAKEMCK